ncbi:MAG: metallophosphoesterase [Mycobacteriales bacterium]
MGPRRALQFGVGLAASTAAWSLIEPHLPVLRRVDVAVLPAAGRPIRVLHLSDLHLLPRHARRSAWVRALAALEPDLVVSTGDHLSSAAAIPLLAKTLGAFTARGAQGVFVPGNNDYFTPRAPNLRGYVTGGPPRRRSPDLPWEQAASALEAAGWLDLTHRRTTVRLATQDITLTGTDDAHLRRDRYTTVAGPVATEVGIGVTHTPAKRVLTAMSADGHQLLLAGHTHGGQVRLPGVGALVTNCDLDRARARGLSAYNGSWLHVSAGLGTSPYAPVRLCCRPEATLLTLVGAG